MDVIYAKEVFAHKTLTDVVSLALTTTIVLILSAHDASLLMVLVFAHLVPCVVKLALLLLIVCKVEATVLNA